ncbi:uncharacterized protein MEPE_06099 [Melanopsichium pennsylvanicum]|uniref:Uncharacterized protein n=2 Tax=Melanopsichium pennsylvanicum TaxID=63383 RepID=A0AAJ5C8D5_9BASI|nr:conserved hypothetical Ustilago-specific protein [Melanopsichium pennsylvanicum 4]SNX87389.1 uncharacterized protein MEPE_06099 [Melanopsichium pennsylvanicum]
MRSLTAIWLPLLVLTMHNAISSIAAPPPRAESSSSNSLWDLPPSENFETRNLQQKNPSDLIEQLDARLKQLDYQSSESSRRDVRPRFIDEMKKNTRDQMLESPDKPQFIDLGSLEGRGGRVYAMPLLREHFKHLGLGRMEGIAGKEHFMIFSISKPEVNTALTLYSSPISTFPKVELHDIVASTNVRRLKDVLTKKEFVKDLREILQRQ